MEPLQLLILGLVQGLTEFLPISSSGHLVLVPTIFGWPDQGLPYDIAAHLGTLLAVTGYYRHELLLMLAEWDRHLRGRPLNEHSRLAWAVLAGTLPIVLGGLLLNEFAASALRNTVIVASTTIGFGLLLWYADRRGARHRDENSLRVRDVAIIGCAQILALVPGTSRSGITITAALFCGLTRQAAARFSFLLSVPVILMAGGYEIVKVLDEGTPVSWPGLFAVTVVSFLSAYLCIHVFLKLVDRIGMAPFAIYRCVLGVCLLAFYYL